MIRTMRDSVASWSVKILMGLLLISFVSFYGWRESGEERQRKEVARVNGEPITDADVEVEFLQMVEMYRSMGLLKEDTSDQMLSLIRSNVVQQIINGKIKATAAQTAGLAPSEEKLREVIQKRFSSDDKKFDMELYKKIVRYRLGTTPAKYEEGQSKNLLAMRFDDFLETASFVTTAELKRTYQQKNEKVNLAYISLDPAEATSRAGSTPKPTEKELQDHFSKNAETYKIPERRKLEIAWLDFASLTTPTETDLTKIMKDIYPTDADAQATGNRIHAAHILFRSTKENEAEKRAKAEAVLKEARAGADFSALARRESEDQTAKEGGDLGFFGPGQMVPEFEKGALALRPGEISGIIKTQFGLHIIQLIEKIPAGPRTVARLRSELLRRWKEQVGEKPEEADRLFAEAQKRLSKLTAKPGVAFKEAAASDTAVRTLITDFVGRSDKLPGLGDGDQVLRTAWSLGAGQTGEPFRGLLSKTAYLARVIEVKSPNTPAFSAVAAKVRNDWMKIRTKEMLFAYASTLLEKGRAAKKGLAELAKAESLVVKETGDFAQSETHRVPGIGKSPMIMAEAFKRTESAPYFPAAVDVDGKLYVIILKSRSTPDWKLFEAEKVTLRKGLLQERANEKTRQWTEWLRARAKITERGKAPAKKAA